MRATGSNAVWARAEAKRACKGSNADKGQLREQKLIADEQARLQAESERESVRLIAQSKYRKSGKFSNADNSSHSYITQLHHHVSYNLTFFNFIASCFQRCTRFTRSQLEALRQEFEEADTDSSGAIDAEELLLYASRGENHSVEESESTDCSS